jgi:hypothetical protein
MLCRKMKLKDAIKNDDCCCSADGRRLEDHQFDRLPRRFHVIFDPQDHHAIFKIVM